MIITNKTGVPDAFVRAVAADPYSSGGSDFTATSLANPPRAAQLVKLHGETIEVEAVNRFASILGQGAHKLLERAARPYIDIIEHRFFMPIVVDGVEYTLSAQIDMFETDTDTLYDWKTTKAWAFSKKGGGGKKPEWSAQLNVARYIMSKQISPNLQPKHLKIIGLLRDWDEKLARRDPGYPQAPVLEASLAVWSDEKVLTYIETRVRAHIAARTALPFCTTGETWAGRRCAGWCDASKVCEQYAESLTTGILNPKGAEDEVHT